MAKITLNCTKCTSISTINHSSYKSWLKRNGFNQHGFYICKACRILESNNRTASEETKQKLSNAAQKQLRPPKPERISKRQQYITVTCPECDEQRVIKHRNVIGTCLKCSTKKASVASAARPNKIGTPLSESVKLLISQKTKENWNDGKYWEHLSDEHKSKIAKSISKRWESNCYDTSNKITSLTRICSLILTDLQVDHTIEEPIGPYRFDICIQRNNLLIELMGDWWHNLSNNIANDKRKRAYVSNNTCYNVLTIWEWQFIGVNVIRSILMEKLKIHSEPSQYSFEFNEVSIKPIQTASDFLRAYHYMGDHKSSTKLGAYLNDKLIAVAAYSTPHREQLCDGQTLELSRFCIRPGYNRKNFASWFLSHMVRHVKKTLPRIRSILTFADPAVGHIGTIYTAANWSHVGMTKPSYWYLDEHGNRYHKLTIWKHAQKFKLSESEFATDKGLIRIDTPPKNRYRISW